MFRNVATAGSASPASPRAPPFQATEYLVVASAAIELLEPVAARKSSSPAVPVMVPAMGWSAPAMTASVIVSPARTGR